MSKASDHIAKGTKCCRCQKKPATVMVRLVARDDTMAQDALVWASARCWDCVQPLKQILDTSEN